MRKTILTLLFLFLIFVGNATTKESLPQNLDKALDKLDLTISQRERYMQSLLLTIDSLKRDASKAQVSALPNIYEKIGDKYSRNNIDSALFYYQKGIDAAKVANRQDMEQRLFLSRVALLPVQGVIKEAIEIYDSIAKIIYPQNKIHFYETGNRLFYFASSFYPIEKFSKYYAERALNATDSLTTLIEKGSPSHHLYLAQIYALKKKHSNDGRRTIRGVKKSQY